MNCFTQFPGNYCFDLISSLYRSICLFSLFTSRYKFYNENFGHHSLNKWHSVNPNIDMRERIIVEDINPAFLQYLHSAALVVELWGLQGD